MQGDIRNFQFKQTFDLITMAGNAFQALLSESDQMQMLQCVRHNLKPSGLFVFTTRNPQVHDFKTSAHYDFWHNFQDDNGKNVNVYGKQQANASQQIVTYTTKRVWDDKETVTEIQLRFTNVDQLTTLLERAELKVCEVYGDYNKTAFEKGSPFIILCNMLLHTHS